MSKRLQVILSDEEMRDLQKIARQQKTTVADWVRRALLSEKNRHPTKEADKKIQVVRAAVRNSFPAAEIDVMLAEIDAGYLPGHDL
jgi:predicted 2-oxoglutarate/Fe(II)-dependent dioxygenase YbiX